MDLKSFYHQLSKGKWNLDDKVLTKDRLTERTDSGATLLILAAQGGAEALIKRLLKAGANPMDKDQSGMTALMWAVAMDREGAVKELLEVSSPNDQDEEGWTALMWAVGDYKIRLIKDIAPKSDMGITDHEENTALDHAIRVGHTACVKELLKWTPLNEDVFDKAEELSEKYGFPNLTTLLKLRRDELVLEEAARLGKQSNKKRL